jgi:hypothetical protein
MSSTFSVTWSPINVWQSSSLCNSRHIPIPIPLFHTPKSINVCARTRARTHARTHTRFNSRGQNKMFWTECWQQVHQFDTRLHIYPTVIFILHYIFLLSSWHVSTQTGRIQLLQCGLYECFKGAYIFFHLRLSRVTQPISTHLDSEMHSLV